MIGDKKPFIALTAYAILSQKSMAILDFLLKGVGKKKSNSVIGIDIGSSAIKVVQVQRKKNKAVLETYGELALGPYMNREVGRATKLSPEQIVGALQDLFREANVTTLSSGISIPMRQSMVTVLKLPRVDQQQLKTMVPLEARKYIPVPISEVTLDWFTIPQMSTEDAEGNPLPIEVLVVAIHNDVLQDNTQVVTSTGMQDVFFEVEMFSSIRAVSDPQDTRPMLILDMGAGATKLYIAERGIVRQSHVVNKGGQDVTLNLSRALGISVDYAEDIKRQGVENSPEHLKALDDVSDLVLNPVFREVNSVILDYERKAGKVVERMVLTGGGVLLHGLKEKATEHFRIPVEAGKPFSKMETPAYLANILDEAGPGFTTAVGIALRKLQQID